MDQGIHRDRQLGMSHQSLQVESYDSQQHANLLNSGRSMSTMKEMLKLMAADFGHSEPVYEGQVSSDGRYISFNLKDPYSPNPSDYEDPVMKVIATHYRESTRNPYLGKIVFKADVNIDRCIDAITAYIYDFYLQKSPLKNPKQSRLYK